jgi:hypothetical protein
MATFLVLGTVGYGMFTGDRQTIAVGLVTGLIILPDIVRSAHGLLARLQAARRAN